MAYTTTINGVTVSISPYRALNEGPGGQPADFDGGGTFGGLFGKLAGIKPPLVTFSFDSGVASFGIDIVGATNAAPTVLGFDQGGRQIVSAEGSFDPESEANASRVQIVAPQGQSLKVVKILPNGNQLAYRALQLVPADAPVVRPDDPPVTHFRPPVVPILKPVEFVPAAANPVNFLNISMKKISKEYEKDSMTILPSETIEFENISPTETLTISIAGVAVVSFDPSAFELPPASKKVVTVSFNMPEVNKLQEGDFDISSVITLVGKDQPTGKPIEPPIIETPAPITPPIPISEPTPPPVPTSGGGPDTRIREGDDGRGENDFGIRIFEI
jgi:hypothetical protein